MLLFEEDMLWTIIELRQAELAGAEAEVERVKKEAREKGLEVRKGADGSVEVRVGKGHALTKEHHCKGPTEDPIMPSKSKPTEQPREDKLEF